MKKFFAVFLVAVIAVAGVFAVDMSIGGELGFGQHSEFTKVGDLKTTQTENVIPVKVDFLLAMDDLPLAFRFNFGTDVMKVVTYKVGETETSKDLLDKTNKTAPTLAVSAAAYYKYDINKNFSVMAGLGLGYDMLDLYTYRGADVVKNTSSKRHMLSMYIDTQLRYEVVEHVELFGGFKFGGNVMDRNVLKTTNTETKHDHSDVGDNAKYSNILWGLSVGAAYKF